MRTGERSTGQHITNISSALGGSRSNHSPALGRSQQSGITTGIRNGWLLLEAILQLDQATGWWGEGCGGGGGLGWEGDGICSNWSKYHVEEEAAGHSALS